ncbi:MAG: Na/Pi symporter [Bdellovibrionota bacterium]
MQHQWTLFAGGLGLFLLAMSFLERGLTNLVGKKFKHSLKNFTSTPIRGIIAGTAATAIMQSSSVVTLMVLAFMGAGILEMHNALGVIFGANLGTTFTGWIVATLGFKIDVQTLAFPLIAVGGVGGVVLAERKNLSTAFQVLAALGMLLLGLDFMKNSMVSLEQYFDLAALQGYPLIIYAFFALFFTAIIQSSSAMMMITLTALNAQLIDIHAAAALAVGADIGTTMTTLLGSIGGSAAKKQAAFAHITFNIITGILALTFLIPLIQFCMMLTANPLYILVAFHSTFNFLGILLFLPFTESFARLLAKSFQSKRITYLEFIDNVSPQIAEASIVAIKNELGSLINKVIKCIKIAFRLEASAIENQPIFTKLYYEIKEIEGALITFMARIQLEGQERLTHDTLRKYSLALSELMHGIKGIKDIKHNIDTFADSENSRLRQYSDLFFEQSRDFYTNLTHILNIVSELQLYDELIELKKSNEVHYHDLVEKITHDAGSSKIPQEEVANLALMNREIYSAQKSIINFVADWKFDPVKAYDFQSIP